MTGNQKLNLKNERELWASTAVSGFKALPVRKALKESTL